MPQRLYAQRLPSQSGFMPDFFYMANAGSSQIDEIKHSSPQLTRQHSETPACHQGIYSAV
jgi:hypothetical protein